MALDEAERERIEGEPARTGSEMERKYRIALALYGVLAVVAWFTIGEGSVPVFGKMIEIRWIPVFVLATFAFRTVMAMQADRIRRKDSR
ncbi:MAG TPA: hypothetical protein VMD29_05885 [Terracidiphilus sp.]|nr:hypothetical protein [Terracidiphilus sp.]